MGFKEAAVLAPVSFFLGILFICFNVDHKLLWGEVTEEKIHDGFQFYTTFFNAPPAIKALLHTMIGVGMAGLVAKLHKWDEYAMFFDGSSLGVYVFNVVIYITVTIPGLQTIVMKPEDDESRALQIDAVRVLAAGNVIMIFGLGGILALQAGQEYARRTDTRASAKFEEEQRVKAQEVSPEKKAQ
ncbi:hypothetical protein AX16_001378 [Volvariella volvacea WC 439]|nr:hypothetical protein AX16_001378 [Volvariella volvacea WC 439]